MEGNTQELVLWRASGKAIQPVWKGEITSRVVEDICFYESYENQQLSVFLLGGRGGAEQRLLKQDEKWLKEPLVIRNMNVPLTARLVLYRMRNKSCMLPKRIRLCGRITQSRKLIRARLNCGSQTFWCY